MPLRGWTGAVCVAGTLAADAAAAESLADRVRAWVPPYALGESTYLQVEAVWAPLQALAGKTIALLNWEALLAMPLWPEDVAPREAQLYLGVGHRSLLGGAVHGEAGVTLNDLRGPHVDLTARTWILPGPEEGLRLRGIGHVQVAWPGARPEGFSSAMGIARWEAPLGPMRGIGHAAYLWKGADGRGVDQSDELFLGLGVRAELVPGWSAWMMAGGVASAGTTRIFLSPSVIVPVGTLSVMAGAVLELGGMRAAGVHLGFFAFGEPR